MRTRQIVARGGAGGNNTPPGVPTVLLHTFDATAYPSKKLLRRLLGHAIMKAVALIDVVEKWAFPTFLVLGLCSFAEKALCEFRAAR
jgi:hypothetical protein